MDKPATIAHIEQAPKALHVRHPQSQVQDDEVSPSVDDELPAPAPSESNRAVLGSRPVGAMATNAAAKEMTKVNRMRTRPAPAVEHRLLLPHPELACPTRPNVGSTRVQTLREKK